MTRWKEAAGSSEDIVGGGLLPQANFGSAVVGVPDVLLGTQRSMVATAAGLAKGQNLTLFLMTAARRHLDPIVSATLNPTRAYLYKLWRGQLDPKLLRAAWAEACALLGPRESKPRWAAARGPIACLELTWRRVGWTLKNQWTALTETGHQIDLQKISPKRVMAELEVATLKWQTQAATKDIDDFKGVAGGVLWIEPLRSLLKQGSPLSALQRGALRAAITKNTWPRARLADSGAVTSTVCKRCGDPCETDWHRSYGCKPCLEKAGEARQTVEDMRAWPAVAREAARLGQNNALMTRALMLEPAFPLSRHMLLDEAPPPSEQELGTLSGTIFTDGTLSHPRFLPLSRGAWAIVMPQGAVDEASAEQAESICFSAPLTGRQQTISRGEHECLLQLVLRAVPPIVVYTDCAQLVSEWALGIVEAQEPHRVNADTWRQISRAIAHWPSGSLEVRKTKAHASAKDVEAGRTTAWEKRWNSAADAEAKAANQHRLLDREANRYTEKRDFLRQVALHLGRTVAVAMETEALSAEERRQLEDRKAAAAEASEGSERPAASAESRLRLYRHLLCPLDAVAVFCSRCRRVARSAASITKLKASPCASALLSLAPAPAADLRVAQRELSIDEEMALEPEEWELYQARLEATKREPLHVEDCGIPLLAPSLAATPASAPAGRFDHAPPAPLTLAKSPEAPPFRSFRRPRGATEETYQRKVGSSRPFSRSAAQQVVGNEGGAYRRASGAAARRPWTHHVADIKLALVPRLRGLGDHKGEQARCALQRWSSEVHLEASQGRASPTYSRGVGKTRAATRGFGLVIFVELQGQRPTVSGGKWSLLCFLPDLAQRWVLAWSGWLLICSTKSGKIRGFTPCCGIMGQKWLLLKLLGRYYLGSSTASALNHLQDWKITAFGQA